MGKNLAILLLLAITACATDPSIDEGDENTSTTEQDLSSNTHAAGPIALRSSTVNAASRMVS